MEKKFTNSFTVAVLSILSILMAAIFLGCDNDPLGDGILTPITSAVGHPNAYDNNILATDCNTCSGVTKEGGGSYIGNFDNLDYLVFSSVDLGENTATEIVLSIGTTNVGVEIQVGVVGLGDIATVTISENEAQGWEIFVPITNRLSRSVSGVIELWLISLVDAKNVQWFRLQ